MLRLISIVYLLTVTVLAVHISTPRDSHHEGEENNNFRHITRETSIDKIVEQLQVSRNIDGRIVFVMKDIELMFKKLLFQNCTHASLFARCNLCVTPEDVMNWYGFVSGELTTNELQDMSVGVIYILSEYYEHNTNTRDVGDACRTFRTQLLETNTLHMLSMYVRKYGVGRWLTEESLWTIMENINKTLSYRLTGKLFFTTHDDRNVFNGANISGEADLKHVTAFILRKLLSKDCIKHGEEEDLLFDIGKVFYRFDRLYLRTVVGKLSDVADEATNQTACLNKEHLLHKLSLNSGSLIKEEEIHEFAQSFVQVTKRKCHMDDKSRDNRHHVDGRKHDDQDSDHHQHDGDHEGNDGKRIVNDNWKPWIGTLTSIAIISLGSLIGILTVGHRKRKYFQHCISFLLSLGVSVLICDAILHLIPHSFGLHGDGHDYDKSVNKGHVEDHFGRTSYLWKCFAILMGVYLFLILELIMTACRKGHGHAHGRDVTDTPKEEQKAPDSVEMDVPKHTVYNTPWPKGVVLVDDVTGEVIVQEEGDLSEKKKSQKRFTMKSINTVAGMILLGDGIHNFMDGIAIGGVFSEPFPAGLQDGVMTSIAILLHELPHELADFAILISTGLSVKQALILNLLSSLTAFAGGIVGLLLGTQWNASSWILAITAGLFLYIAVGTMLPEVLHHPLLKTCKALVLIDLCGLAVGLILMLLLSGYEEDLKGALKSK